MSIYFDNAATTKPYLDENFIKEYIDETWYNPSSVYAPAVNVWTKVNEVRKTLLNAVGLKNGTAIFTSGGTEANNTAIMGFSGKRHFVTSAIEHSSVYEAFKKLEQQGHSVDYIRPKADFSIDAREVAEAVKENTALVSVMHVNNETGVINDIAQMSAMVKRKNPRCVFHSDGVQAFLKTPISLANTEVDLYSVSAHKINAFKGTGALIAKRSALIKPFIVGGGQESALRSGTENTFGILAFGEAIKMHMKSFNEDLARMGEIQEYIISALIDEENFVLNIPDKKVKNIVSISALGVRAETMLHALEAKGIYVGNGSACSAKKNVGSRVLASQGISGDRLLSTIRVSLGTQNTLDEAKQFVEILKNEAKTLRRYQKR